MFMSLPFHMTFTVLCPQVLWGQVIFMGEGRKKGSCEMVALFIQKL